MNPLVHNLLSQWPWSKWRGKERRRRVLRQGRCAKDSPLHTWFDCAEPLFISSSFISSHRNWSHRHRWLATHPTHSHTDLRRIQHTRTLTHDASNTLAHSHTTHQTHSHTHTRLAMHRTQDAWNRTVVVVKSHSRRPRIERLSTNREIAHLWVLYTFKYYTIDILLDSHHHTYRIIVCTMRHVGS